MRVGADKDQGNQGKTAANEPSQSTSSREATFEFDDNRSEVVQQRKLQAAADNSPQAARIGRIRALSKVASVPAPKELTVAEALEARLQNPVQRRMLQNPLHPPTLHDPLSRMRRGLSSSRTRLPGAVSPDVTDRKEWPDASARKTAATVDVDSGAQLKPAKPKEISRSQSNGTPLQRKIIFSNIEGDDGTFFLTRTDRSQFTDLLDESEVYALGRLATSEAESIRLNYSKFAPLQIAILIKQYVKQRYASVAGMMTRAKERIGRNAKKFALKYSKKDFFYIFDKASDLALASNVVDDLIYTGSRKKKPKTAEVLAFEMKNWVTVVSPQGGRPYKFDNQEIFTQFGQRLHAILEERNLPHSDVRIQGSALRNPRAGDVDIAVMLSPNAFKQLVSDHWAARFKYSADDTQVDLVGMGYDEFLAMASQISKKDKTTYKSTGKARSICYPILQGLISGKDKRIAALTDATDVFATEFPDQNVESISIVVIGGEFDMEPSLKI